MPREIEQDISLRKKEEAILWISHLADGLGQGVDPGIEACLVALRILRYKTTASCQGHGTAGHPYSDRGLPYPWIDMEVDRIKRKRLEDMIPTFHFVKKGSHNYPLNYRLVPREIKSISDNQTEGNWNQRLHDLQEFAQRVSS